VSFSGRY